MKGNLNVNISLPPSELALLKKLAKAMGWNLFVQQDLEPDSNNTGRQQMIEKLYGCIQLPENFDYKKELEQTISSKYNA